MPTIRVVDIETTGMVPPEAEVIELGWQDVHVTTPQDEQIGRLDGPTIAMLFGSVRPCPPEVLAVHHIMDAERRGLPCFDVLRPDQSVFKNTQDTVAFAAHNAAFEQMFLTDGGISPLTWLGLPFICTYKCALHLWPDAPSHSNQALRYWLGVRVDAERAHPPHRAGPDAYVTAAILQRMLEVTTLDQLLSWSREPTPMPVFRFGKHKGQKIGLVDRDYLEWVVNKSDLEADVKHACRQELQRRADMHRARAPVPVSDQDPNRH